MWSVATHYAAYSNDGIYFVAIDEDSRTVGEFKAARYGMYDDVFRLGSVFFESFFCTME